MYLRRLELSHIRVLADAPFEFTADGARRQFTVILAENGLGKSTLLQAIALAAAGVGGANKLVANAAAFFDRRFKPTPAMTAQGEDICSIQARFEHTGALHATRAYPGLDPQTTAPPGVASHLYAPEGWKQFDGGSEYLLDAPLRQPLGARERSKDPLESVRALDIPRWFVAGYGPWRTLPVPRASSEPGQRSIDRLQSLFKPEPLIATGFVDILGDQFGAEVARQYADTLRNVLVGDGSAAGILPVNESIRVEDVELRGQGGVRRSRDLIDADRFVLQLGGQQLRLPAVWLSAGYQSTIAWIADLLGQVALEAERVVAPQEIEGLVLIDEIDLHLHPRWQTTLIPSLRRLFPRVQFVATTHSPMVLPGLRPGEVMVLSTDERGDARATFPDEDPRLLTASQLYREFFGIPQLFPAALGDKLRRYGLLAGIAERTDAEDGELWTLHRELRAEGVDPGDPVPRELPRTSTEPTP